MNKDDEEDCNPTDYESESEAFDCPLGQCKTCGVCEEGEEDEKEDE